LVFHGQAFDELGDARPDHLEKAEGFAVRVVAGGLVLGIDISGVLDELEVQLTHALLQFGRVVNTLLKNREFRYKRHLAVLINYFPN